MLESGLCVLLGATVLIGGGEGLVRAASALAFRLRLTPTVIGLTVMALGTSFPELVVSVQAQLAGSQDIAFGNVVGSNLFNIGAVLGFCALLRPLAIPHTTVRLEWPFMMLASGLIYFVGRSGPEGGSTEIDRLEGSFLVGSLIVFTGYMLRLARRETSAEEARRLEEAVEDVAGAETVAPLWRTMVILVLSSVALWLGSDWFVLGAQGLAKAWGISERVIGLTVVAAGTGAPEFVATLVAVWRGKTDMAVANVVGSNIFNCLGILGVASLVKPLPTSSEILGRDIWWMLGISLGLGAFLYTRQLERWEGGVLFGAFVAFTVSLLV